MTPLKFGIPKGSLERATIEVLRKSGWRVSAGNGRSYFPSIDDDEIVCSMVRAQEMSRYVELGTLDCGVTGKDWTLENGSEVEVVCELVYSKDSLRPTRWVVAVPADSRMKKVSDLQGKRIATELVRYTERYFAEKKVRVSVEFSWGATEAKVSAGLCDAIVEVTETGSTLRANGLKIIDEIMVSTPQIIANREALKDRRKRAKIEQVALMMQGALRAQSQVGIKLNVRRTDLDKVIALLPSITAPTVANLYGTDWVSVESVVSENVVRDLAPKLVAAGAEGIIEYPLNKIF